MVSIPGMTASVSGFIALLVFLLTAHPQDKSQPTFVAVQEILNDNCVMCHNGPKAPKGLQLTSYELLMKGSENGAVVVAADPGASEIVRRVKGISKPRMPFGGEPLADGDIKVIEEWIADGAKAEPSPLRSPEAKQPAPKKENVTFADVQPIFKLRCQRCHTESGSMGPAPEGFIVSTYETILDSRERARVVPGNPAASELVRKIRGQSLPRMPFDGPPYLSDDEIEQIERWIKQGAANDQGERAPIPVGARVRLHGRLTDRGTLDDLPLQSAGRVLVLHQKNRRNRQSLVNVYRGTDCADCQLRAQCTTSKHGRLVHRYHNQDWRDRFRQRMRQASSKAVVGLRKCLVEHPLVAARSAESGHRNQSVHNSLQSEALIQLCQMGNLD